MTLFRKNLDSFIRMNPRLSEEINDLVAKSQRYKLEENNLTFINAWINDSIKQLDCLHMCQKELI